MIYYINALKTDDNTAGPKAPNDIYKLTKEYNGNRNWECTIPSVKNRTPIGGIYYGI